MRSASNELRGSRLRSVRVILVSVLLANLAVAAAKLLVGWWTDSISMVADGFHSLTDGASNIVGLVGISLAARPPDETHQYGHEKFETMAALAIGGLLALTAWEVLKSCLERMIEGGSPRVEMASWLVMGVTIAVNLIVSTWEGRQSRTLDSPVLAADAAHTRSDVAVSLGVVGSLLATRLGFPQLDAVVALGVTVVIARAAYAIVRESATLLLDPAFVPEGDVRQVALGVPGVVSVHGIRTRARPGGSHAEIHVQVRPDLRIDSAHAIGHAVAQRLSQQLGIDEIVTHVEPPADHPPPPSSVSRREDQ